MFQELVNCWLLLIELIIPKSHGPDLLKSLHLYDQILVNLEHK